jgi:hypothetical protein
MDPDSGNYIESPLHGLLSENCDAASTVSAQLMHVARVTPGQAV